KMNLPDALYAGRMTGPLVSIRRELSLANDPNAEALGQKIDPLVSTLREQRRDPTSHSLPDLVDQAKAWLDELKASAWGSKPAIATQLTRFDQIVAEYQQAKDNPDAAVETPGGGPINPAIPPGALRPGPGLVRPLPPGGIPAGVPAMARPSA